MYSCKVPECDEKRESQRSFIYHIKNDHNNKNLEEYLIKYENLIKKKCKFCNNKASFDQKNRKYRDVCSNRSCIGKLANEKSKQSVRNKYGVSNVFALKEVIEKSRKTKENKYGNPKYNNIKKAKQTCLSRYGVDNGSKTPEAKEKISKKYKLNQGSRIEKSKITFLKKYGVDWNMKNPKINKKTHESRKKTILKKIHEMDFTIIKNEFDTFLLKCNKCNHKAWYKRYLINRTYKLDKKLCNKCYYKEKRFRSNGEKELLLEISKLYKGEILTNKKLFGYEADIYLPDEKLVLEYNGVYWHSELYRDSKYHKNKKIKFAENNINLINIWEDDWKHFKKIIISRIKNLFHLNEKIYARKCILKEISPKEARDFMNENHLKGYTNSKIKVGLFYKDKLVSVSTFGKRFLIKKNKDEYELLRNCTLKGFTVIGGFQKMIKYFIKKYSNNLYSYVDCDWTNLNKSVYHKSFKLIKYTSPGYYWVINGIRENRIKFQKHRLVEAGANPFLTEYEIMSDKGYFRIYDSGNLLFKYKTN